jgi:hypothetical protein
MLQDPLLIAFDQFIEQPQYGLDHPRLGAIFRAFRPLKPTSTAPFGMTVLF